MSLIGFRRTQVAAVAALMLLAPLQASAQTDAGAAAQENRDIAGRWLGASDAAVQEFGKAGGTLTNASLNKFEGVSAAISKADWAAPLGAASAGDVRGFVSGAVAIKVGAAATGSGAALFGEVGAVAGGVVGSFFPVIGNIAGTMVGGAIGTAAGGFITAYGYDKYVKDYVSKGVVAGIASVFDTAPLDQAMEAKRQFLWDTMAPEERAKLQGFNPQEVQLIDFATLPYVPVLKQSAPTSTALPEQTVATTGNVLAGVHKFSIGQEVWDISGGVASHQVERSGVPGDRQVETSRGTVSVNRIDGTMTRQYTLSGARCSSVVREIQPFSMVFTAERVTGEFKAGSIEIISDSCKRGWSNPAPQTWSAPWRRIE